MLALVYFNFAHWKKDQEMMKLLKDVFLKVGTATKEVKRSRDIAVANSKLKSQVRMSASGVCVCVCECVCVCY